MKKKVTVEEWVELFRAAGLDDVTMKRWHDLFEGENPEGHQDLLKWLGLPAKRIADNRVRSKCSA